MRFSFKNSTVKNFKLKALEADAKARKSTRRAAKSVESETTDSETTEGSEVESEPEAGVFRYINLDAGYFERKATKARGRPQKGEKRVVETGDWIAAGLAAEDEADGMPRKSNVSQATAATGDEGTPVKDRDGINIEDLSLPRTMVQRLAKGVLPPNTQIQKDAITAMSKSATVFVNYISHHANNATLSENRRTIAPKDVYEALQNTEFASMIPRLEEELKRYVEIQTGKRNEYRKKVKESGPLGRRKSEGGSGEGEATENGDGEAMVGVEVEGAERGKKRPRVREPKLKGLHTTASVFKSVNARAAQNKDTNTNGGTSTVSSFTPTNAPSTPATHTPKVPAHQADSEGEAEAENANDTIDEDSADDDNDNEEGGMGEEAGDEIEVENDNDEDEDREDEEDDDSPDEEMRDSEIGDSEGEDPEGERLGEDEGEDDDDEEEEE